jgi:signal transduction histidine kinase
MLRDTTGNGRARSSGLHRRQLGFAVPDDLAPEEGPSMSGATTLEARSAQFRPALEPRSAGGVRTPETEASRELRHEVGNALTTASAYAQWLLLRRSADADEREVRALQAIRDSVARAVRLLDRHPASRPEAPRRLEELVEQAIRQVPAPRVHDIRLRRLTQDVPRVCADPDAVVQIVTNLLSNAAKYSRPGTPIEVEIGRTGGTAAVIVRDRGIGFAPELTDAIFDGYRTPEASRMADGEGIGLRLSRRLARQAGGRLWAASTPGRGTVFHLDLPLGDEREVSHA